jgi:Fur family ferric uptake transcriptional regulator
MQKVQLKELFSAEGLKSTKQRQEILDIFLKLPGHKNLSQIYTQVSKANPKIGYSTVYRTLKLFTRLGLAAQRKFEDGETRYEPIPTGAHHDHLICINCGKIIEFKDETIEALQTEIAQRYKFKTFYHRMELYGHCIDCSGKKAHIPKRKN